MTPEPALETGRPAGPFLTAAEVAERWRVADETIHRWCREGTVPYVSLPSGLKRFRLSVIEAIERGELARPTDEDDVTAGAA